MLRPERSETARSSCRRLQQPTESGLVKAVMSHFSSKTLHYMHMITMNHQQLVNVRNPILWGEFLRTLELALWGHFIKCQRRSKKWQQHCTVFNTRSYPRINMEVITKHCNANFDYYASSGWLISSFFPCPDSLFSGTGNMLKSASPEDFIRSFPFGPSARVAATTPIPPTAIPCTACSNSGSARGSARGKAKGTSFQSPDIPGGVIVCVGFTIACSSDMEMWSYWF